MVTEFKLTNSSDYKKAKRIFCKALATGILNGEDVSRMSITRLCDLAGLSRTTFYANYSNIADVQNDLEDYALGSFSGQFNSFMNTGFVPDSFERSMKAYIEKTDNEMSAVLQKLVILRSKTFYDKWTAMLKVKFQKLFVNRPDRDIVLGVFVNVVQYGIREYLEEPDKYKAELLSKSICDLYKAFMELGSKKPE
ncbi:MAG: hypothetical protein MJ239_05920 [Bacilli bacterium]|nr:hypothetical protein [Bacilli bacterium]